MNTSNSTWSPTTTATQTVLAVSGMTCGSCVRHVTHALQELDGVGAVVVARRDGLVTVTHDPATAPIDQLIAALHDAGYPSQPRSL